MEKLVIQLFNNNYCIMIIIIMIVIIITLQSENIADDKYGNH